MSTVDERMQVFNKYGVQPFGPRTEWSVRPISPVAERVSIRCTGEVLDPPCEDAATMCVIWRAIDVMSAPAFWYFCDRHGERYKAWAEVGAGVLR